MLRLGFEHISPQDMDRHPISTSILNVLPGMIAAGSCSLSARLANTKMSNIRSDGVFVPVIIHLCGLCAKNHMQADRVCILIPVPTSVCYRQECEYVLRCISLRKAERLRVRLPY